MFSKTQCRATVGDVAQGDAETCHVAVTLDSLQRIFHSVIGSHHMYARRSTVVCLNLPKCRHAAFMPQFSLFRFVNIHLCLFSLKKYGGRDL